MPMRLRQGAELESSVRRFLDDRFRKDDDLRRIDAIEAELRVQCSELEAAVVDLDDRLRQQLAAYASSAETADGRLRMVRDGLIKLRSQAAKSLPENGEGSTRWGTITADNLLPLAKEVARVETVHAYAETALKLDRLIGEIEDAVASAMTGKIRPSSSSENFEGLLAAAVDRLMKTEDIVASISRSHPQWPRLISAVDDRVDRALTILRPQAIATHRSLLSSIGWPPPLSSSTSDNSVDSKSTASSNPLLTMNTDQKQRYSSSFLALCHLQDFQCRRRGRHLGNGISRQPLWVIVELATPVSLSSQKHFPKWIRKPEFIFALVYKIIRDQVNTMDEILQPLVDQARLVGYSCREEWVASMVSFLTTYLAKDVFPAYLLTLEKESSEGDARTSWLNLVDQMMMFDKRARELISGSGFVMSADDEEDLQRISSMAVFSDRPDWLDLWAETEFVEALDQLKPELDAPRNWKRSSSLEEFKTPTAAAATLRRLSALIERCRPLPSIHLRSRFVQNAMAPLMREFTSAAVSRCQEAEALTALVDDEALSRVCSSINGARHCESTIIEWWEDMFFLEMAGSSGNGGGNMLEAEAAALQRLRAEWVEKIKTAITRGFEAAFRDHIKNKKQWQEEESEEGESNFSRVFVGALDYLQGKLQRMEMELNEEDFVRVWRGVAAAMDQLLLGEVLLGGARFSGYGIVRFRGELAALCGVFSKWCLRPEGFFPRAVEGLRLLQGGREEAEQWWPRYLSVSEADRIVKSRC